jgi:hypothetical protein
MSIPAEATRTGPLSPAQVERFGRDGFLVFERFLPEALLTTLKAEADQWVDGGREDAYAEPKPTTARMQLALPEHGMLISHPPTMDIVGQLLGPGCAYHHLHTTRFDAGADGIGWHQDYQQLPQTSRIKGMLHVFYYPNGLDGTIGDLLILPGSQTMVIENNAFRRFGTVDLPGSIVIDALPPGSAVVIHSAVLHARRAKPGGEGRPRYLIDISYCQAGVRWFSDYGDWRAKLATARRRGLDRGGRYAHLFDDAHFFDVAEGRRKLAEIDTGASLVERFLDPPSA